MPTGYTADVANGKVTDFPTFATQCARAFGALILMRDDPMDAPIPEKFEASDYNTNALATARAHLKTLISMTPEAAAAAAAKAYDDAETSRLRSKAEGDAELARYRAMRTKVEAWTPPTAEHVGLKSFMLEQLDTSAYGWSAPRYYDEPTDKAKYEPEEWLRGEIDKAHRDIGYHAAEREKEIARTEGRNSWVAALRASLQGARS